MYVNQFIDKDDPKNKTSRLYKRFYWYHMAEPVKCNFNPRLMNRCISRKCLLHFHIIFSTIKTCYYPVIPMYLIYLIFIYFCVKWSLSISKNRLEQRNKKSVNLMSSNDLHSNHLGSKTFCKQINQLQNIFTKKY